MSNNMHGTDHDVLQEEEHEEKSFSSHKNVGSD
jgi:hypothetical protein